MRAFERREIMKNAKRKIREMEEGARWKTRKKRK